MNFIKAKHYQDMSRIAAEILAHWLRADPRSVVALPTGSTPIGTYAHLAYMYKEDMLDFSQLTFFNVDEYVGCGPDSEAGYYRFLWDHFYREVNVTPSRLFAPDGLAPDPEKAARIYEEQIEDAGGLKIAFLGMGRNGHIGFNEPADVLQYPAHCVTLTPSTIEANARFFTGPSAVPSRAITIGVGTIMQADHVLLVVSGRDKQEAMFRLQQDSDISTMFPASVLRLHHDATVVMADA